MTELPIITRLRNQDSDWIYTERAEAADTITELLDAANKAFDFLGGVDDAAEIRGELLKAILKAGGQHDQ